MKYIHTYINKKIYMYGIYIYIYICIYREKVTKSGTSAINVQIRDMNSLYTSLKTWVIMTALLTLFEWHSEWLSSGHGWRSGPPGWTTSFLQMPLQASSRWGQDSAWFWRIERQNVRELRSYGRWSRLAFPPYVNPIPMHQHHHVNHPWSSSLEV